MRNFVLPIPLTAERYVKAWEFRTNAPQVVHHATMVLDPTPASRRLDEESPEPGYEGLIPLSAQNPDGYFLGWTPGQSPSISRDDMAWRLNPGNDLVLMLHLRPTGQPESVEASVGLYFTDVPPTRVPAMVRLNRQDHDIPAGESQYIARDSFTLPVDVDAYSVQPHAHNLAREVKAFATRPDGTKEWLLYIRDWDFHWQDAYRYRQPVFLPAGTQLSMEFVYDNSLGNRANPNLPPRRVIYGQRTTDEMGDVWIQVVPRQRADLSALMVSLRRKLLPQNIQGYRTMLQSDPDNAGLHDDLALLSVEAGDFEAALAEFSQSLRLRPDLAAAHYNVGNALLLLRRFDEAETHFRAAIDRSPDYKLAQQGLALVHYNLGVLRQQQKQFDAALAEYREALRMSPDLADAHFGVAMVEAGLGHAALAVESLRRALAIRPEWPAAQFELARILATSGEPVSVPDVR
jgi:tetratricopeptide (TPR) repeat protein